MDKRRGREGDREDVMDTKMEGSMEGGREGVKEFENVNRKTREIYFDIVIRFHY